MLRVGFFLYVPCGYLVFSQYVLRALESWLVGRHSHYVVQGHLIFTYVKILVAQFNTDITSARVTKFYATSLHTHDMV